MINLGIEAVPAEAGQALDLGAGAVLEVLAVTPRGAVLLVRWDRLRLLLPIGQDFATPALEIDPVDVLLLAESGFAPLNPAGWIASLDPGLVLLSVAAGNREGLPSAETLKAIEGRPFLRTDRDGWIELVTDGSRLWVSTRARPP